MLNYRSSKANLIDVTTQGSMKSNQRKPPVVGDAPRDNDIDNKKEGWVRGLT
jgi:hypothetical protein